MCLHTLPSCRGLPAQSGVLKPAMSAPIDSYVDSHSARPHHKHDILSVSLDPTRRIPYDVCLYVPLMTNHLRRHVGGLSACLCRSCEKA